jgi:hypothetical protein
MALQSMRGLGLVALVLLATTGQVQAHGAPPMREFDTRVLLDDDGLVSYGGCLEGQCQPAAPAEGFDLLALDLREAAFPDGSPAIVFRVLLQSEAPVAGGGIAIALAAGGVEQALDLATSDGLAFTSATFDRVDGPFDVGDGHPKAVEGWIRHAALGVAAGDALTAITVRSHRGETADDAMPGGWSSNGVEVPHVPHGADPDEALAEQAPGQYPLRGPASLVAFTADPAAPDLSGGPATVVLRLANNVSLPQFADLAVDAPAGIRVRLAQPGIVLDGNGSREVELHVDDATANGLVRVTLVSDLGAHEVAEVAVRAPFRATTNSTTPDAGAADAKGKETPGPAPLLPLLLAAGLLGATRRQRER